MTCLPCITVCCDPPNAALEWQAKSLGWRSRKLIEACPLEGLVRWPRKLPLRKAISASYSFRGWDGTRDRLQHKVFNLFFGEFTLPKKPLDGSQKQMPVLAGEAVTLPVVPAVSLDAMSAP